MWQNKMECWWKWGNDDLLRWWRYDKMTFWDDDDAIWWHSDPWANVRKGGKLGGWWLMSIWPKGHQTQRPTIQNVNSFNCSKYRYMQIQIQIQLQIQIHRATDAPTNHLFQLPTLAFKANFPSSQRRVSEQILWNYIVFRIFILSHLNMMHLD